MSSIYRRYVSVLVFLLFPLVLLGQGNLGTITGLITDPSGAVIPAAKIKITETQTNVVTMATTTAAGVYTVAVPPGTYTVQASKTGFKTAAWNNVIIDPAKVVTVNLHLTVGSVAQTVVVSSRPPLLNTTSAQVGSTVTLHEMASLPTGAADGGRDPEAFIFSSLPGTFGCSYTGSVGGGQYFSTDVMVDGISVLDYQRQGGTLLFYRPGFDAFREVTVQQSGYNAQYGNSAGGIINFQMKSGTNQLHGDVFDFFNNTALGANGFDFNAVPEPNSQKHRPQYNDNNFGVDLGGPIVIPHIYNGRDKSFFFVTYEGDRYRNFNFSGTTTLPTPQMLQGDFSQLLGSEIGTDDLGRPVYQDEIYNPTTTRDVTAGQVDPLSGLTAVATGTVRDPFVGNVIPIQYLSTASKKILPSFPTPTINSVFNNMPTIGGSWPQFSQNLWSIKVDHVIGAKHRISAYFDNNAEDEIDRHRGPLYEPITPGLDAGVGSGNFAAELARFSEDWSINNHMLNHFGLGYNRLSTFEVVPYATPLLPSNLGLSPVANDNTFPQLNFSGHMPFDTMMGFRGAENDVTESYILTDTFTDIVGKHTVKIGGQFVRFHYNNFELPASVTVNFNTLQTAAPGFETETGHQFASFLLGAASSASYAIQVANPGYRQNEFEPYVQDTWHVTRKLTLDYGLRWSIPSPKKEAFNRMSNFSLTGIDPAIGVPGAMQFLGNCSACTGKDTFQNMYWGMVAPRFGLAYNPTKNLVIRGAYGIDYMPDIQNGTGYETLLGFNSAVGMNTSLIPNPFPALNPALYWTGLSGATLPSYAHVGFLPFTGHLPDTSPSISEGQGVDY
ncbi:MAG: TonB-dependent receptor domain-containing protein, partial [Terriglobia bacterium]